MNLNTDFPDPSGLSRTGVFLMSGLRMDLPHSDLTKEIIGCALEVYHVLGGGFLERVYANALADELSRRGIKHTQEHRLQVSYKGSVVGEYYADLLVDGRVIVELKASSGIVEAHEAQLLNYLRATKMQVGLIINFGDDITFKRKVMTNH